MSKTSDKGQVKGTNSVKFSKENKTSSADPRQNMGAIGMEPGKMHPNAGTQKRDYQDNVKGKAANQAFKHKVTSGNSNRDS